MSRTIFHMCVIFTLFELILNLPLFSQEIHPKSTNLPIDSLKSIALKYNSKFTGSESSFENESREIFNKTYKGDSLEFLYSLSYAYFIKNDYVRAIKFSLKSRNQNIKISNKRIEAELLIIIAYAYQRLSYAKKSIYYYNQALTYSDDDLIPSRKNRTLIDLGNSYYGQGNNDSALYYYLKANENALNSSDSLNIIASLINLGNLYMKQKDFDKAEEITNRALVMDLVYKTDYSTICNYNLGQLYFRKKLYLQSRSYFEKALTKIRGSRYESLLPEIYKHRAVMDFETGNFEFAIQNCRLFQASKNKYKVNETLLNSLNTTSRILVNLIDRPHAKELLYENINITDSLIKADFETKRVLEESYEELTYLEKNFKILEQENLINKEKLYNSRLIILFTVIFLILTGIAFLSILRAKNKIRNQNEIISNQLANITKKNLETSELNSRIKAQAEKISLQNEHLTKYQDHLEQLINERTIALSEALVRAQESDRLKTSFLQNISHEIRTPLNAISGFSQLLSDNNKERQQYIDYINQNVYDLIDMVENIMIFSKIYSNQVYVKKREFPLRNLIDEINNNIEDISGKYKDKMISFTIENEASADFKITTDFYLLRKILIQLIDNSYKFTEKGQIKITFSQEVSMLKCLVSDTGIGIKQDQIPSIFETFRKIEGEHKLFRGTGIGLSIVKNLIIMLDGEIFVESEFGVGTTMKVIVPIV